MRWQVQSRVGPLTTSQETVSADRWHPETQRPDRNWGAARRYAVAALAPSLFFAVGGERWSVPPVVHANTPQVIYVDGIYHSGSVGPVEPQAAAELLSVDKWGRTTERPTLRLRRVDGGWVVVDASQLAQAERASQDKWQQPQSQPFPFKKPPFHAGWSVTDVYQITQAEAATVDRWWRLTEQPYPYKKQQARQGWSVTDAGQLTQSERASLDKWSQPLSKPYLVLRYPVRVGQQLDEPFALSQPERVSFDKWGQPQSQPYPHRRLIARLGLSVIDTSQLTQAESITFDKWQQRVSEPRWDVRRNQFLYPSVVSDSQLHAVPGAEQITLNKWTGEAARIARRPRAATDTHVSLISLVETLTLDKWQGIEARPLRGRPLLPSGLWAIDPLALTALESVSFDRWHFQQSEPRRDARRWQFLYPALAIDSRFEFVAGIPVEIVLGARGTGIALLARHSASLTLTGRTVNIILPPLDGTGFILVDRPVSIDLDERE